MNELSLESREKMFYLFTGEVMRCPGNCQCSCQCACQCPKPSTCNCSCSESSSGNKILF